MGTWVAVAAVAGAGPSAVSGLTVAAALSWALGASGRLAGGVGVALADLLADLLGLGGDAHLASAYARH